jgi:signal peptidase II
VVNHNRHEKKITATLPGLRGHVVFWSVAAAGLALDLWTKAAVFGWLQGRHPAGFDLVGRVVRLVVVWNDGAAFGIASGRRVLLVAVSAAAVAAVIAIFFSRSRGRVVMQAALGLFCAGVCGNLYDRVFNGGLVRDFIDVVYWPGMHWPAFNVADTMLCAAVGLLVLTGLRDRRGGMRK